MTENRSVAPLIAALCLALGACAESHISPDRARIVSDRVADGEIALALGESVLLDYHAFDEDGNAVDLDPDCVHWTSSDGYALPILPLSPAAGVKARAGWFDSPPPEEDGTDGGAEGPDAGAAMPEPYLREPQAVITLDACGAEDGIVASSVLSVAGTWQIAVGTHVVQTVTLAQHGRTVSVVPIDDVAVPVGTVRGDILSISMMGFDLRGRITSPTEASGTVVGVPGEDGAWTAVKHTSLQLAP